MLRRIGMAIVVCLVTILACFFLAMILGLVNISVASAIGEFLEKFAVAIGLLVGLWWYFFRGGGTP